jgi:hypothetical protein
MEEFCHAGRHHVTEATLPSNIENSKKLAHNQVMSVHHTSEISFLIKIRTMEVCHYNNTSSS